MTTKAWRFAFTIIVSLLTISGAFASADAQSRFDQRARQLVAIMSENERLETYFSETFLAAVPPASFKTFAKSLILQFGKPVKILSTTMKSSTSGIIKLAYQNGIATVELTVEPDAAGKITGLLVTSIAPINDTLAKIDADFATLPGRAGYVVERLDDGAILAARASAEQFAVASTFKLYILAELADQVASGARAWSDVVTLTDLSFSSPATSRWPRGTPMTLQTLAIQMISVSDNSATDTLLRLLGRTAVERQLRAIGHSDPDHMLPILSTVEAFALKGPANRKLRETYLAASNQQQAALLTINAAALAFEAIDLSAIGTGPAHIDTVEWFASPVDIVRVLDNLRRRRDPVVRAVLAINPGIPSTSASQWQYLGYKGGSEAGVIAMNFLVRNDAHWFAVAGSWNNSQRPVNEKGFAALMIRLLDITANQLVPTP